MPRTRGAKLSDEVVRVTLDVFRADPARWGARADVAARVVVTNDTGNVLFVIVRQRAALPPLR
jgi:hypothetical protein